MVDNSLDRPPQAEVYPYWVRQGNQVNFSVHVKNLSGTTLSSSNSATVHVIVYEDKRYQLTNRFVITALQTPISNLGIGAWGSYSLQTGTLSGVDWSKLHYIALVDYIPNSSSGIYDMLQAAIAVPPPTVQPDLINFLVDNDDTTVPTLLAHVQGPANLTWNVTKQPDVNWLQVTLTGDPSTPVQFTVNKANLINGWQADTVVVSFSSLDGGLSDQVTVKAYLGELFRVFLPVTAKP